MPRVAVVGIMNPYRKVFDVNEFVDSASVALVANVWTETGRYTVPAGVVAALGYGSIRGQEDAEGRFYFNPRTSVPADINCEIRLELRNAQDRVVAVLWEGHTILTRTSTTDRRQQIPFPELVQHRASEDYSFVMMLRVTSAVTLDRAQTTLYMDGTLYDDARAAA